MSQRKTCEITYMQNIKNNTNEYSCKTETDSDTEIKLAVTIGDKKGGGIS